MDGLPKPAAIAAFACCAFVFSTVDIAAMAVASKNEQSIVPPDSFASEEPCESEFVGFPLATWLLAAGVFNFCVWVGIALMLSVLVVCERTKSPPKRILLPIAAVVTACRVGWSVVGMVLLAVLRRGAYDCAEQYPAVWEMAIVQIVYTLLHVLATAVQIGRELCCSAR